MAWHGRFHYGARPGVTLRSVRVTHLTEPAHNYVWKENNYV
jgi:hypothetical protein